MKDKYYIKEIILFLPNEICLKLLDNKAMQLHKIIRYSYDAYYSSSFVRSIESTMFFNSLSKKAFKIVKKIEKVDKFYEKDNQDDIQNNKFNYNNIKIELDNKYEKTSNSNDKEEKDKDEFLEELKENSRMIREQYKIRQINKIFKFIGFKTKIVEGGIDILGWRIPKSINYTTRFDTIFYLLLMICALHGSGTDSVKNAFLIYKQPNTSKIDTAHITFSIVEDYAIEATFVSHIDYFNRHLSKDKYILPNIFNDENSNMTLFGILKEAKD